MADIVQGSDAWKKLRRGKVTGSRCYDVTTTDPKGKPKAAYLKLLDKLALELVTDTEEDGFQNEAMRNGTMREPVARTLFAMEYGVDIRETAFIEHPSIPLCGWSPDGLIDSQNACVEIKCPQLNTHYGYIESGKVPNNYMAQIVHGFSCVPSLTHCYFISYSPEAPQDLQLWVKVIERNDKIVAAHEERVKLFVDRLYERVAEMKRKFDAGI